MSIGYEMKGIAKPLTKLLWLLAFALPLHAAAETVEYIHTDALGTPIAVTDASGNLIETSEYEPYGKLLNRPVTDGPGFTGHVQDAATGLTYMQQRYYDPVIGRFLSVDPITVYESDDWQFFTRYAYAFNNPYGGTDPDGRAPTDCGNGDCDEKPSQPPPPKVTTLDRIKVTPSQQPAPPSRGGGDPFRPQHVPSFFQLTTFSALRRDMSTQQAVDEGTLTRTVTLPAVMVVGSTPVSIPAAIGVGRVGVAAVGTVEGRELLYGTCVVLLFCQTGKAPMQRVREEVRLQQVREGMLRDNRQGMKFPKPKP